MKYTNKLNLPQLFMDYVKGEEEKEYDPKKYSVTELLKPVKEILLTREHQKELECDIVDKIPAIYGTAAHSILEKLAPNDWLKEYSVSMELDGITISGRIDALDPTNQELYDYKTCSVSKITKGDFGDWDLQALIYCYILYFQYDIKIKKCKFFAIMKDWSKLKSCNVPNYPQNPLYIHEIEVSDSLILFAESYLKNKLKSLNNAHICECSDEERWYSGTVYAVYKKAGDKKATYLAKDEADAHNYITNKLGGAGEIQVRKGEYLKCKYYCNVSKYCERSEQ